METGPTSSSSATALTKLKAQEALVLNKQVQQSLIQRVEKLETQLKDLDRILSAVGTDDDDSELGSEVIIPGAKKATGLLHSSEFLNPESPFYEHSVLRSDYVKNTSLNPLKEKDLEMLATAVRKENERLQAYKALENRTDTSTIDLDRNIDGLNWTRIAERVSDMSSTKRTALECRVCWIGNLHPDINHEEWTTVEQNNLKKLVSERQKTHQTISWVDVASQLGTNRTPLDCLKHSLPRPRVTWTSELDQKLIKAVETYGLDNWQLVARNVSEYVAGQQCLNRWTKSLDPMLKKGSWTLQEDERLRQAVAGYGASWVLVAAAIPGRTNDQCRERWIEYVSPEATNWTEAEDQTLLSAVAELGKQWKSVSLKVGNSKTSNNCRTRFTKLRSETTNLATSRRSNTPTVIAVGGSATPRTSTQLERSATLITFAPSGQETTMSEPFSVEPIPEPAPSKPKRPAPRRISSRRQKFMPEPSPARIDDTTSTSPEPFFPGEPIATLGEPPEAIVPKRPRPAPRRIRKVALESTEVSTPSTAVPVPEPHRPETPPSPPGEDVSEPTSVEPARVHTRVSQRIKRTPTAHDEPSPTRTSRSPSSNRKRKSASLARRSSAVSKRRR